MKKDVRSTPGQTSVRAALMAAGMVCAAVVPEFAAAEQTTGTTRPAASDGQGVATGAVAASAREILALIEVGSAFEFALNDAHAEAMVLLRRTEREPPSPARDRRLQELRRLLPEMDRLIEAVFATEVALKKRLMASDASEGGAPKAIQDKTRSGHEHEDD